MTIHADIGTPWVCLRGLDWREPKAGGKFDTKVYVVVATLRTISVDGVMDVVISLYCYHIPILEVIMVLPLS